MRNAYPIYEVTHVVPRLLELRGESVTEHSLDGCHEVGGNSAVVLSLDAEGRMLLRNADHSGKERGEVVDVGGVSVNRLGERDGLNISGLRSVREDALELLVVVEHILVIVRDGPSPGSVLQVLTLYISRVMSTPYCASTGAVERTAALCASVRGTTSAGMTRSEARVAMVLE